MNMLDLVDIYPFKSLPIQLIFEEKIVNLAIKAASQQQSSSSSSSSNSYNDLPNEFNCLFTASPVIDEETSRLSLIIDGFDQGKSVFNCNNGYKTSPSNGFNIIPTSQVPGCIYVPVRVINNGSSQINGKNSSNSNLLDSNQNPNIMNLYANSVNLLSNYCTSNSISIDSLSNFISIFSTISYRNQANTISADLSFDTVSLSNRFVAQAASPMPILTTALSKALQSAINFYSTPKTGYCTIYQNNKILLVLESDPKANTLPLIGIWISGIREVNHPLVWSACMRYKFSSSILKRVNDDDDSFLIVLFPSTHKKPEFYKCTTTQFNLEFTLFSGQEKLITTKSLCNNMLLNKASHIDDRFITVDLCEITEGFKFKSFINAINELSAWKSGKQMTNGAKKAITNEDPLAIDTPIKQHPEFQVHSFEQINRSQCVSEISFLSDDGSQPSRRFLSFDNNNKQQQQQMYEQKQHEVTPLCRPGSQKQLQAAPNSYANNTHSMLFGIPRNPPLPIGFAQPMQNEFNNESNYSNQPQQQQQQQQQEVKRSPPQQLYNNSSKFEQINEYSDDEDEESPQSQQQMNKNYHSQQQQQPPPQLKRQMSYPTFTQTEPINKIDQTPNQRSYNQQTEYNETPNLRLSGNLYPEQQQQQQQQYSSRRSSDFTQTDPSNGLIQTPKGLMTQQDLLNLVFKQDEQLKTLQEQINRLLATNQYNNNNNNSVMTDNSKNSHDTSSSNERMNTNFSSTEQRSMSSLKSHMGSEMSQNEMLNNSQTSIANKAGSSNSGGMCHSTSVSSNMGSLGNSNNLHQHNNNNNNNNIFNCDDNTTMYRSIEHGRDSPIMLFEQSVRSNDDMQSTVECFKQPQAPPYQHYEHEQQQQQQQSLMSSNSNNNLKSSKSDESNNSWKSSNSRSNFMNGDVTTATETTENIIIKNSSSNNLANLKKAAMLDDEEDDDDDDDDEEDRHHIDDERYMNVFNTALNRLNKLGVNVNEHQLSTDTSIYDPSFLPKLQYVSMYLDEVGDKNLSMECNALAMKYLKDEQLAKVAKGLGGKRGSFSGTPMRNRGGGYLDAADNDGSTMCESNNFSLASKQYLDKYFPKKTAGMALQKQPPFDRSLSTPVNGTNAYYQQQQQPMQNHKQLYSDGDIKNDSRNGNGNADDDQIWVFGNPNSRSNDSYMNKSQNNNQQVALKQIKTGNHQMEQKKLAKQNEILAIAMQNEQHQQQYNRQQHNNDNGSYKVFGNEDDDTSHILDVETLKKLPKLL